MSLFPKAYEVWGGSGYMFSNETLCLGLLFFLRGKCWSKIAQAVDPWKLLLWGEYKA